MKERLNVLRGALILTCAVGIVFAWQDVVAQPLAIPPCIDQAETRVTDLGEPLKDSGPLSELKATRPNEYEGVVKVIKWLFTVPKPDYDLDSLGARDVCLAFAQPTMPATRVVFFAMGDVRYRVRIQSLPVPARPSHK